MPDTQPISCTSLDFISPMKAYKYFESTDEPIRALLLLEA